LVDAKGVHVILEAVAILRGEGFTDFLVEINGDNIHFASKDRRVEIESFLEKEAELLVEDRNVIFNGSYHPDQLPQRMARIDWCIVPSIWWEIFCLVISEAWTYRRPVIASNAGGPAERITHNVDGLLFDLGDARALARTIRRACGEQGLWDQLVSNIRPPPTRDIMVDGFLQIYRVPQALSNGMNAAAE
jgi:glycosyltransferase involved in cell wall biosynthesis